MVKLERLFSRLLIVLRRGCIIEENEDEDRKNGIDILRISSVTGSYSCWAWNGKCGCCKQEQKYGGSICAGSGGTGCTGCSAS